MLIFEILGQSLTLCRPLLAPVGTVLCALHQAQRRQVAAAVRGGALPPPGGVPGAAGERPSAPRWLRLQTDIPSLPAEVSAERLSLAAVVVGHLRPVCHFATILFAISSECPHPDIHTQTHKHIHTHTLVAGLPSFPSCHICPLSS